MSFSNYLENALLNHTFKNSGFSQPTNIYVALSTANPGEDGSTISEPVANNYSRVVCNAWTVASTGAISNASGVVFPTAGGSWGTITHSAIFDASSGGNMLGYSALSVSKTVTQNDIIQCPTGSIVIGLN